MHRSLAFHTDLALRRNEGSLIRRGDHHTVICSPDNPTFWWGNFLLMPGAPRPGDLPRWEEAFSRAFPDAAHRTFGIDTPHSDALDLSEWQAAGYEVLRDTVLTAAHTVPSAPGRAAPRDVQIRPAFSDADWEAAAQLRLAVNAADPHPHEAAGYEVFVRRKLAAYRAVQEGGRGALLAAFDRGGAALSALGIFDAGEAVARYQSVETHPGYRARGLAGMLVHAAAEWARALLGTRTLVIVADPDYHAQALYERLGFRPTETQLSFQKRPPDA
ncbi:hypothetical protein GCM10008959_02580 [Deinococcus seoulensis]|uniref:N-acetyltransferase domain-containing protein n=1 Tax=Deinococcus seoulensis TaxID=1837379 RepID=A0ABQ2RLJ6_9DEIO|nr:GNAT family N-acetyltransferase [Deinococcus seoulensis]GGR44962.1 hypothetical protein GCM10008959_02580 [Deinococcus seoulensis]